MSDYISREAFVADCEGRYCAPCKEQGKDCNGVRCRACWVDDMIGEVLDAPAADVEPVRRGRWVHDGPRFRGGVDWWHCTNCGGLGSGVEIKYNYCHHCGAKMDLEVENDG